MRGRPRGHRCHTVTMPESGLEWSARWGRPDHPLTVDARMRAFLHSRVGTASPWHAVPMEDWQVPPSRLPEPVLGALRAAVGDEWVRTDRDGRLAGLGGASFSDYARRRAGDAEDAPDAVVMPASHDEVLGVLEACADHGIGVVPLGGGTSVVAGLRARHPFVVVSLARLGGLLDLDAESGIATVGPGITGPMLEPLLAARGFTLGHLPQSWQRASIGGYVATRSAGQASTGYGRSDEMVESLLVATPQGTLEFGRAPSTAAGPDVRGLVIGSEGAFGIITRVALRVRRLPSIRVYEGVLFPNFVAGREAFRDAAQSRSAADVMRLSDEAETATTLLMSGPTGLTATALQRYLRARGIAWDGAALAIVGWEGTDRELVKARRSATLRAFRRHGGVGLGRRVGASWQRGRFQGPYLRDTLMDAGYLVETVETATEWRTLPLLHLEVHAALEGALGPRPGPYVMSHISHVYETGASLYTTVLAVADQQDPVRQWEAAKRAVTDAIMREGATLTHHHAVGRDHAPWLEAEVGPLGVRALRAVKAAWDPSGAMNPGAVLEE